MRHLDLFSGIGGFALAARRVGWETVGFCEIDPYCQKVLAKHWPDVPIYEDVRELSSGQVGPVDIITGGFPCQDISLAGKQAGIDGERSGLWSELARLIGDVRPSYAILENVTALISGDSGRWFGRVLGDLVEIGYDCEWHCIPAAHVGAPHRRDRVWIIAYPVGCGVGTDARAQSRAPREREELQQENGQALSDDAIEACSSVADAKRERPPGPRQSEQPLDPAPQTIGQAIEFIDGGIRDQWATEPDVGRVANGIPKRVDRLRCLGNAIVPQVAETIFRSINAVQTGQPALDKRAQSKP